jgi:serine/threonine-protein kinase
MALRKEPERRYASAGQLAEDVTRFLGGWPVIARPDTAGYRFRRFVGRNRVPVATAALLAVTLVGATGATAWQSQRRAEALRVAEAERARATRMTEFLLGIFRATNPNETRGRTVTARELLDQAAVRARRDLARDPDALADMELAIGRAYAFIGSLATADSFLTRAAEARRTAAAARPLEFAEALEWQARIRMQRGKLDEGTALMQEVVAIRERELGPDSPLLGAPLRRLGTAHIDADPYDTSGVARAYYERALRVLRTADPPDVREIVDVLRQVATLTMDQDRVPEAVAIYREALETASRTTDPDDPFLLNLRESLALGIAIDTTIPNGRDSAIAIHRQNLEARIRVFGPEHMDVTYSLFNLGRELYKAGYVEEGIARLKECVAMRERLVGPDHGSVVYAYASLGRATMASGDRAGGIAIFRKAVATAERVFGADNPGTVDLRLELAESLASRR